jgi:4-amino-4-deoxy-L-arabinose transferase-like glycosyltransferase
VKSRRPRWLALTLLLVAFALRCWRLGAPSLWYDEAYTWWVATQVSPQHSIASSLREIIPPFTYVLWRGWAAVAGTSEFALRAPSALLSIVGIAAAARIVWRLTRRRRGVIAALALFAIAPPLLWAAREVRMYGPLLALTLCAEMALLEVLFGAPEHRRRWAWLWGATMCAALYTLVLAGFWLLGQGLFVLWMLIRRPSKAFSQEDRRVVIRALVVPTALALLLYLPWLMGAAQHLGENRGYWAGHLPPAAFVRSTLRGVTVGKFLPADMGAALGGGIVILAALTLALTRHIPWAGLYPLLTTIPPLTILCYIYRDLPKWAPRHAALFAPAPLLTLAIAWSATATLPARRRWRRLATALLAMITLATGGVLLRADANLLLNPAYAHDDWRGVAAYVRAHRQPDDIVIIETGAVAPTWYYYAGAEQTLPLPPDDLLDVENVLHYTDTAPLLTDALREASGVWVVTWLADVTDPTGLVLALLRQIGKEQSTPEFHEVGLHYIALNQDQPPAFPALPPTTARPEIELLPHLTLWGYRLPAAPHPADAPLAVATWWRTSTPKAHENRAYGVSLRLYDADEANGEAWQRIEGTPGSGDYRPERWPADALVLGHYEMPLPAGIPPGVYRLELILYEQLNQQRRAALPLGEVQITRPQRPPAIPAHLTPVTPTATSAPLRLLAAGANRSKVKPCETLSGQLFWEVAAPLTQTFEARVALGDNVVAATIAPRVPPETWQAGDRVLSHFHLPIHCRSEGMRAPLEIALVAPNAPPLSTWDGPVVEIDRASVSLPPDMTPLDEITFGPALAHLRGYTLEPAPVRADRPFTLTLYWQPLTITETAYTVFVHVTPAEAPAPVLAQDDAWPGQGAHPTYGWRTDEIIADPHPLPALPPGAYALRVGLYDPATGQRLPIAGLGAAGNVTDRALAIPFTIQP